MPIPTRQRNLVFLESEGRGAERDLVLHDHPNPEEPPYPPPGLMQYDEHPDRHREAGMRDATTLKSILQQGGFDARSCRRFLEFGCSNGRVLRWFGDWAEWAEGWGVDINSNTIQWAVQAFPKLNFAVTTTAPHLPFPDNYHDLTFSFSVFTHIDDLFLSWMAEIWRVLRPGGFFFFTIIDEASLEVLKNEPHRSAARVLLPSPHLKDYEAGRIGMLCARRDWMSLVLYKRAWLLNLVQKRFALVSVTERTMALQQTGILVRKPA